MVMEKVSVQGTVDSFVFCTQLKESRQEQSDARGDAKDIYGNIMLTPMYQGQV